MISFVCRTSLLFDACVRGDRQLYRRIFLPKTHPTGRDLALIIALASKILVYSLLILFCIYERVFVISNK